MTTLYRLKFAQAKPLVAMTKLVRVIDVNAGMTFDELHTQLMAMIGTVVPFYQFFITRQKNYSTLTPLANTSQTIGDVLNDKDYFYYQLQADDSQVLFRLRVEKITSQAIGEKANDEHATNKNTAAFEIVDEVGVFDDHFAQFNQKWSIKAALMVIGVGNPPVRYSELVRENIAEEMVALGLIKPCINHHHIVRLTPHGERELVGIVESLGE